MTFIISSYEILDLADENVEKRRKNGAESPTKWNRAITVHIVWPVGPLKLAVFVCACVFCVSAGRMRLRAPQSIRSDSVRQVKSEIAHNHIHAIRVLRRRACRLAAMNVPVLKR